MDMFAYSLNLKNVTREAGLTKRELNHLLALFTSKENRGKAQARREWISFAENAVNTSDAVNLKILLNLLRRVYEMEADLELEVLLHYYQGFYHVINQTNHEAVAEFEQVIVLATSSEKHAYGYDPFNLYSAVAQAFLERLKGRNKARAFFRYAVPQTANVA